MLLRVAAHVMPPLPAETLDWAFDTESLHALLACCTHAKDTKKPSSAKKILRLRTPSHSTRHIRRTGQLLGTTIQEPRLQDPHHPFRVRIHPLIGSEFPASPVFPLLLPIANSHPPACIKTSQPSQSVPYCLTRSSALMGGGEGVSDPSHEELSTRTAFVIGRPQP